MPDLPWDEAGGLKAVLSTEARNSLPDSAFACILGSGDSKERLYPHHRSDGSLDLPHLRNALSRVAQSATRSCGVSHLEAHAEAEGLGDREKGFTTGDGDLHTFVPMAEIKSLVPHEFKLSETGDVVVAFAQTDAVDGDQDYTFAGAFPAKNAIISDFGHSSWPERGGRLPTGKGAVKEHGGYGVLEGKFAMETDQGRNAYHTVKFMGDDQRWSYGYDVLEKAAPPPGVKAKRGLKLLDVHEVSPVLLAAQITTHTMGLKARADGLYVPFEEADEDDGLKFGEMSERLLADAEAFTARAAAIQGIRVKEGRALSAARRKLLEEHHAGLLGTASVIRELLDATAPKPKGEADPDVRAASGKARAARAAAALAEAEFQSAYRQN